MDNSNNLIVILLDHEKKKNQMVDCAHTWRKKLRLQELMIIARKEIESGEEIELVYETLEDVMEQRWRFVQTTKRQYIEDIKKILANQYVLTV